MQLSNGILIKKKWNEPNEPLNIKPMCSRDMKVFCVTCLSREISKTSIVVLSREKLGTTIL